MVKKKISVWGNISFLALIVSRYLRELDFVEIFKGHRPASVPALLAALTWEVEHTSEGPVAPSERWVFPHMTIRIFQPEKEHFCNILLNAVFFFKVAFMGSS